MLVYKHAHRQLQLVVGERRLTHEVVTNNNQSRTGRWMDEEEDQHTKTVALKQPDAKELRKEL